MGYQILGRDKGTGMWVVPELSSSSAYLTLYLDAKNATILYYQRHNILNFISTLLLSGVVWCVFASTLEAQPGYRIEKYDARNGLSSHWVSAVQQDRQGFIWLALQNGMLARFDGTTFSHFAMSSAERQIFGGNSILNLRIDAENHFWVSVQNQLALFNPATGRFSKPTDKDPKFDMPANFFQLSTDSSWERKGFQVLDNPKRLLRKSDGAVFNLQDATIVYDIIETGSEIWVAAFEGLYKITPRKRLFETPVSKEFNLESGPVTGMSCYGIAESGDWLWFIGDKALLRTSLKNPGKVETVLPAETVGGTYQLIADREGWLWPGRFSKQIAWFNSKAALPLSPVDPAKMGAIILPPGATWPEIRSFMEMPNDMMWAATANGILEIDRRLGKITPILSDSISNVWHLFVEKTGIVWAGTEQGLYRISPGPTGLSWQITGHYHPGTCKGFGATKILSINEADGMLWLGSDAGLIRFNPKAAGNRESSEVIARTFSVSDGLPNAKVYYALPEGHFLWCGTDKGLARISIESALKNEGLLALRSFHVNDGLPHEEFNTLAFFKSPASGKIYLGGLNGLTIFMPQNIDNQEFANPPLRLEGYEKYDRRLDSTLRFSLLEQNQAGPVVFEYFDQFFTFHFALLSYTDVSQNRYRYRMEGYEKNWIEAGNNNFARYTALPPGQYTFRVQAADCNGNWSPMEIALPVLVRQAWFWSGWAWALYLTAAGCILFLIYRQRLRRARLAAELQLEHARSMHLEEMDGFKSRFFTNISHEFRTPLTVILGTTEQLTSNETRWKTGDLKRGLDMIKRNGENLLLLINQILDLAKLENKSLKISYVQGDVLAYLRYVAESLHSYANAQNVLLRVESNQAKIVLDYAPEQLLSIAHNLLSNAVKFIPSGGRVTMRADLSGFENQESLVLSVADSGAGIPAADLPFIFDRFFQAGNTEHSKTGGTGIGLALTKELVQAMGGDIQVESEMGKGTVFTLRLPVTRQADRNDQMALNWGQSLTPAPAFPAQTDASHATRLLLIEDSPDVLEYLAACLDAGYRLDFAYNGSAGIEKALETVPDLIISDVMMPGKDGLEVCDFLKNDPRTSHIPIILLTAKADLESRITGLTHGADAYLAKPFHPKELQVTVANLLEIRRKLQVKYRDTGLHGVDATTSSSNAEDEFLKKVRAIVESEIGNADLSPEHICRKIGMGHTNLNLKMNALTGMPVTLYIRSLRLLRAKALMTSTAFNISEIAYEVGFNDPKYFSRVFSEEFGLSPGDWRKANAL
jgi:signal transduction histidine kinase/DNA-binding response OmpR family regulator